MSGNAVKLALMTLFGVLSCSGPQAPAAPPAPVTHLQTPALAAPRAPRPTEETTELNPEFDLESFEPLLASARLARVAELVESDNPAKAALTLKQLLEAQPPSRRDAPRYRYLLARLQELAGRLESAGHSYVAASRADWPLRDYALLGAGRVALRRGLSQTALTHLRQVKFDGAITEPARLLLAEAAELEGQLETAIGYYRDHLAAPDASDRALVGLKLGEALLGAEERSESPPGLHSARAAEALSLARAALIQAPKHRAIGERARELERRALSLLPASERSKRSTPTEQERLALATVAIDARDFERALSELAFFVGKPLNTAESCEAALLRAKALAGTGEWGRAADSLIAPLEACRADIDYRARALYSAGKYAALDNRHTSAISYFQKLEQEAPHHRLADDARLKAALSYLKLGVEARFTELLRSMPEDYPAGDMVLDGVFELALRRIEKGDWSGAGAVLASAQALVRTGDSERGQEFSGRERYFWARALIETGESEHGLEELESIVRELPLSYYMLQAYSRLLTLAPERAERARRQAAELALKQPFRFAHHPDFEQPAFVRAMELLRVGDLESGKRELSRAGLSAGGAAPPVLWGVALLYARAGAIKASHDIARGLLTDWLRHWPAGDWTHAWQIAYPRPYRSLVARAAERNELSESLIYAVMREESAFDPQAVSLADAYGLMQLILPTARRAAKPLGLLATSESLKVPRINIALGSRTLGQLSRRFKQHPVLAIPGYNAGPNRPIRWLKQRPFIEFDVWVELIPFRETRRYTKRVLASRASYAALYAPAQVESTLVLPLRLASRD